MGPHLLPLRRWRKPARRLPQLIIPDLLMPREREVIPSHRRGADIFIEKKNLRDELPGAIAQRFPASPAMPTAGSGYDVKSLNAIAVPPAA